MGKAFRIGPELKIRSCDALLFWRVQERVLVAIEREVVPGLVEFGWRSPA